MNIKSLQEALPYLFEAEVTGFIWGHAGLGKSTVIKQYAQDKGYKFFPFYLGTQSDLGDILGLAEFVRNSEGRAVSTDFAPPKWLVDTIDYCNSNPDSGAIIFLDEFNRARRDILNGMFSLALDKSFHTLKLPKNCHIIAAGNPPTDEYYVTDVNETALMARFCHIKLEPTFEEWTTYAAESNMDLTLVNFLKEQPMLLEDTRSEFQLPIKVDRRAWSRLDKLIAVDTPTALWEQLAAGIIGLERLVAYKQFLVSTEAPLSGNAVLVDGHLTPIKQWSNPTDIKSSLLSITCDNVSDVLKGIKTPKYDDVTAENLTAFIETLPLELAFAFLRKIADQFLPPFIEYTNLGSPYYARITKIVESATGDKVAEETKAS